MDRTLSNQFLIIINFFEYVGGFVLGKILGNTFPNPRKIFNQQKPKENLKEKNVPRYLGSNYTCLVGVVPKKVKRKLLPLTCLKSFTNIYWGIIFNTVSSIIKAFDIKFDYLLLKLVINQLISCTVHILITFIKGWFCPMNKWQCRQKDCFPISLCGNMFDPTSETSSFHLHVLEKVSN